MHNLLENVLAQWGGGPGWGGIGPGMMGGGYGMGWFGLLLTAVFWVVIIAGLVFLVKWLAALSRGAQRTGESALEILKSRYAKGEIDSEEFERKKKDILD